MKTDPKMMCPECSATFDLPLTPSEQPPSFPYPKGSFALPREVSGNAGEFIREFVPTRFELRGIARYYYLVQVNLHFDWFNFQQTGRSERCFDIFASWRLDTIKNAIGEKDMKAVVESVDCVLSKEREDEVWRVFMTGTAEERQLFHEDFARKAGWLNAPPKPPEG